MKSDLVIIGGGIIGLYSAYLLAQRGINITLIDRGEFGKESSWVAGGILTPLLPWDYQKQVLLLTANSSNEYDTLANRLLVQTNIDIEYWKCGLTIFGRCSDSIQDWCINHKLKYEHSNDLQRQHFHLPEIAQVRMPKVIKALIKSLNENNVTLLSNTSVNNLHLKNNQVVAIDTSIGNIKTHKAIWANGAWLPELANSTHAAHIPSITPIKGQVIAIQAIPGLLNHITYHNGHYLIPRKDGLIIAGSTLEKVGYDKSITNIARDALWENSISMLPELSKFPIVHQWAGLRPGSPNNIPTIGPHPEIKGLYLSCGHFRYGVAMAPESAHIICKWIMDSGDSLSQDERDFAIQNY
ncbi:MAG: FAD-dependent oxidoreductase [Gammaproteobacteria bacterium]|nr:FAD-dependent oxidoreductase [Gammaproteobacteria bacterium]